MGFLIVSMQSFVNELRRLEYYESKLIDNRELIEDDQYRFLYKMKLNSIKLIEELEVEIPNSDLVVFIHSVGEFCKNVKKALPPYVWEGEDKTYPPY